MTLGVAQYVNTLYYYAKLRVILQLSLTITKDTVKLKFAVVVIVFVIIPASSDVSKLMIIDWSILGKVTSQRIISCS